eukprot:TRINITY_DN7285_c0_g1_i6.p1 TRINITY_DN7285_c0_g1~~TRINITY_DN7285_c0_g1_i6.p1  ORF type:complete len:168 (+),score=27.25 TRINITY_DN7285_c0_g1_i6:353-856(+)
MKRMKEKWKDEGGETVWKNVIVIDSGYAMNRTQWPEHLEQANGIVFVVDTSDVLRLWVARKELLWVLDWAPIATPVLLLANKQDKSTAVTVQDVADAFELSRMRKIHGHRIHIIPCVSVERKGNQGKGTPKCIEDLISAMKWLNESMYVEHKSTTAKAKKASGASLW